MLLRRLSINVLQIYQYEHGYRHYPYRLLISVSLLQYVFLCIIFGSENRESMRIQYRRRAFTTVDPGSGLGSLTVCLPVVAVLVRGKRRGNKGPYVLSFPKDKPNQAEINNKSRKGGSTGIPTSRRRLKLRSAVFPLQTRLFQIWRIPQQMLRFRLQVNLFRSS